MQLLSNLNYPIGNIINQELQNANGQMLLCEVVCYEAREGG